MRRLTALAALLAACASPGIPPGGPPDKLPPVVLSVSPESGSVGKAPRGVVVHFDEVISERPSGAAELDNLVLISPRDGAPRVDWHRNAITIRPRADFRSNTVYTVTLLPGIADLRGNVRDSMKTIVFSTGPAIPSTHIRGIVFDWVAGRPAPRASIEALSPDSTAYVTQTDSTGRFDLAALPPDHYVVRGWLDQNHNHAVDPREIFDSALVALSDSARLELLAFVHDSIGPRITVAEVRDSMTVRVAFDKPVDPGQTMDSSRFAVIGPDSAAVPIRAVRETRAYEAARADSLRIAADSAAAAARRADSSAVPLPVPRPAARDTATSAGSVPSRPSPVSDFILLLAAPLTPGETYVVRARDVRGLLGTPRSTERTITAPKRVAPPPAAPPPAPPDSTRPPGAASSGAPLR